MVKPKTRKPIKPKRKRGVKPVDPAAVRQAQARELNDANATCAREWKKAIGKQDVGMSAKEIAALWDIPLSTAKRRIFKGVEAGIYTAGRAYRIGVDGKTYSVPVYRINKDVE